MKRSRQGWDYLRVSQLLLGAETNLVVISELDSEPRVLSLIRPEPLL
jgi:hypothetical protein